MKQLPIVALIGQTNAGKSSLLNRFAHKNIAIVAREEGTTRDNVVARIDNRFLLIDTAGLKDPDDDFEATIQDQIADAIASADLILLTLDSSKYPDQKDKDIARKALKSRKPVLLLLNKSDLGESLPDPEFLHLGIKPEQTFRVSATTGRGIKDLKSAILTNLMPRSDTNEAISNGLTKLSTDDSLKRSHSEASNTNYAAFNGLSATKNRLFSSSKLSATASNPNADNAILGPVGASKVSSISQEYLAAEPGQNHGPQGSILRGSPTLENDDPRSQRSLKIALIGRPNVGKSSLFNSLGKKQQAIVSSRQGTTRDVNRINVKFHGKNLEILDTAGLRKPGKREVGIEKFSALRTLAAIEESDICALLVDATEPHSKLDQSLAGQIIEAGKGIIVVLTKTDLLQTQSSDTSPEDTKNPAPTSSKTINKILDDLERDFNFLPYAPVLITSSVTGKNVTKLFELALEINATRHLEIKTSELNKILGEAILEHPPAGLKNTRPKLKYIVQTDVAPPWFVVHGRDLGLLHWSYKRFLERKIREKYPFVGTPIMFSFRNDSSKDSKSNKSDNSKEPE